MNDRKFGMSALIIVGGFALILAIALLGIGIALSSAATIPVIPVIVELIGGILLLVGVMLLATEFKNRAQIMKIVRKDHSVIAKITGIENGLVVKGKPLVHILCEYRDDDLGESHVYRGMDMRVLPKNTVGGTVRVYLDPDAPGSYFVDMPSLVLNGKK